MNIGTHSNELLPAADTQRLVKLLRSGNYPSITSDYIDNCAKATGLSRIRIANTTRLLFEFDVLTNEDSRISLNRTLQHCSENALYQAVQRCVLDALADFINSFELACPVQATDGRAGLWLNSRLLPQHPFDLPFLIIEYGIAIRDSIFDRFWRIENDFEEVIESFLAEKNELYRCQGTSETDYQKLLERKAEIGLEAEHWVLRYESNRLNNHRFRNKVTRISEENVGAGFDILSFSSTSALVHDRFIEVKSVDCGREFFWTQNERNVARNLGNMYWIYLVDRNAKAQSSYQPLMINDPYNTIVVANGWTLECSTFKVTKP